MNSSGPRDSRATRIARGGGGVQCPPSPCPLRPSETASGEAREADTGEPGRGVVADGCWVGGGRVRGAFQRCGPTSSPGTRVCVPDTDSGQRRTLRSGRGRGRVGAGMSLGAGRTRGRRRGDRAWGQGHRRPGPRKHWFSRARLGSQREPGPPSIGGLYVPAKPINDRAAEQRGEMRGKLARVITAWSSRQRPQRRPAVSEGQAPSL